MTISTSRPAGSGGGGSWSTSASGDTLPGGPISAAYERRVRLSSATTRCFGPSMLKCQVSGGWTARKRPSRSGGLSRLWPNIRASAVNVAGIGPGRRPTGNRPGRGPAGRRVAARRGRDGRRRSPGRNAAGRCPSPGTARRRACRWPESPGPRVEPCTRRRHIGLRNRSSVRSWSSRIMYVGTFASTRWTLPSPSRKSRCTRWL